MATYGYTRVSSFEQTEGTSLEEQERRIRGVALAKGLQIDKIFSDPAVSGAKQFAKRPSGEKLLKILERDDVLIISSIDRGFRNTSDALHTLESFQREGIKLIIEQFGSEPVASNGTGRLVFQILAAIADWERQSIREKLYQGRKSREAKGGFVHGRAPFGFKAVGTGKKALLKSDSDQIEAIQTIGKCAEEGNGLRTIVNKVQEKHGITISHVGVARVIDRHFPSIKRKRYKKAEANQSQLNAQ